MCGASRRFRAKRQWHFAVEFSPEAKEQLEDLERYLAERFYPANSRKFPDRLMVANSVLRMKTPMAIARRWWTALRGRLRRSSHSVRIRCEWR